MENIDGAEMSWYWRSEEHTNGDLIKGTAQRDPSNTSYERDLLSTQRNSGPYAGYVRPWYILPAASGQINGTGGNWHDSLVAGNGEISITHIYAFGSELRTSLYSSPRKSDTCFAGTMILSIGQPFFNESGARLGVITADVYFEDGMDNPLQSFIQDLDRLPSADTQAAVVENNGEVVAATNRLVNREGNVCGQFPAGVCATALPMHREKNLQSIPPQSGICNYS